MKKIILITLVSFLLGCERTQYGADTFFSTTSYAIARGGEYSFSRNNNKLLVSHNATGIFNSYSFDINTGEMNTITNSESDAIFALSYFPEDERVLVSSDKGGNERNHIFVVEKGDQLTDLTPGKETRASFLGFSSNTKSFYIASNERDSRSMDVYRYSAESYERELIFKNSQSFEVLEISNNDKYLVLSKSINNKTSHLYMFQFNLDKNVVINITPYPEGEHLFADFSPDSTSVLYTTDREGEFTTLKSVNISSLEEEQVYETDWDISGASFSPQGSNLLVSTNEDATSVLRIFETESMQEIILRGVPDKGIRALTISEDEKVYAYISSSDTSPGDIFLSLNDEQKSRKIASGLSQDINEKDLVTSQVIRYKSFDGLEIPSILYKPAQASKRNKVPALVYVHGGPGGQTRKGYNSNIQFLVNNGYAVIGVNNRGSSGYGKTFYHMDDKRHGEEDLLDVVWAKKYLQGLDWIDSDSIGVMGGSYGGFMTLAAMTFHPDEFEVGIDIFGVSNWIRTLKSIPPWWESFKVALYDEMGDPETDEERHRAISPLFHAKQISKPLLVIQGSNDPRVLQVESDEMVEQVKENGVYVDYLIFSDEGHGFRKKVNRIAAAESMVSFLDKCLRKKECN